MGLKDEILAANAAYVEGVTGLGALAMPPARGALMLTCMDARLDPARFLRHVAVAFAPLSERYRIAFVRRVPDRDELREFIDKLRGTGVTLWVMTTVRHAERAPAAVAEAHETLVRGEAYVALRAAAAGPCRRVHERGHRHAGSGHGGVLGGRRGGCREEEEQAGDGREDGLREDAHGRS